MVPVIVGIEKKNWIIIQASLSDLLTNACMVDALLLARVFIISIKLVQCRTACGVNEVTNN